MHERDFLQALYENYAFSGRGLYAVGDDCAVLPFSEDYAYVVTSDILLEGVHFDMGYTSVADLAYKSFAVNVSDVLAMGAVPRYLFVSLALPQALKSALMPFYDALNPLLRKYRVRLLGGDLSAARGDIVVSVTAVGVQRRDKILYRNNAQVGDFIYVTGFLGDAAAGLYVLQNTPPYSPHDPEYAPLVQKHKRPDIRLREFRFLQRYYSIHAAIDLSDGLLGDLSHVLEASRCGALLFWNAFRLSPAFEKLRCSEKYRRFFFNGGEDYELLFTTAEEVDCEGFLRRFGVALSCIGVVTEEGLALQKGSRVSPLCPESFDHYRG